MDHLGIGSHDGGSGIHEVVLSSKGSDDASKRGKRGKSLMGEGGWVTLGMNDRARKKTQGVLTEEGLFGVGRYHSSRAVGYGRHRPEMAVWKVRKMHRRLPWGQWRCAQYA